MDESAGKNTDPDETERLADEALQEKIRMYQEANVKVGSSLFQSIKDSNWLTAENMMLREIGAFGPWYKKHLNIDRESRDRLLAHGREDAANALLTSLHALELAIENQRSTSWTHRLLVTSLVLNGLALLTLWLR